MALQVGRITGLNEPRDWDSSTNRITLTGSYKAASITDGLQKRDQLLGYANEADGDEPAIPVIIDGEPRVTGFYRVLGVQVLTDEFTRKQGNIYDYRLDLEPVFGFANPLFESILTGAVMSNGVGAVTGDMITLHGAPAAVVEYFLALTGNFSFRSSVDGSIQIDTSAPASGTAHFYVPPVSYYVGAAKLEQGTNLLPVVGRQVVQADVVNWRLSNGLVRVTPNVSGGKLDVRHWSGTAAAQGTANILSPNESSFEGGIGSFVGANCTLAQSAVQAADGTKSIALTASSGGDMSAQSGKYAVSPSTQYTAVASFRTAVTGRTVLVGISWFDSSLASLGTNFGSSAADSSAGWTQVTYTGNSPSNAAYAAVTVYVTAAANTEVHYVDKVGLVPGASTTWQIGGWSAVKTYKFAMTTAGAINAFTVISVLRNSPEETIIRLGCTSNFGVLWGRIYMDLALRRGDNLVRGWLSTDTADKFSVARDVTEAATAITYGAVTLGGIRATSNDADGNRYVLLSYSTASPVSDLVNGKITQNLATNVTFDFGIGSEITGSSAGSPNRAVDIAQQYLAVQSEKMQAVSR